MPISVYKEKLMPVYKVAVKTFFITQPCMIKTTS